MDLLVFSGAGFGGSREKGRVPASPRLSLQHPSAEAVGRPGGGRIRCPVAFLSSGASSCGASFPRLYLSLVLGNVNVTLLSKQAK